MNPRSAQRYSVPIGEPGSSRCCEWRWPDGIPAWTQSERDGAAWFPDGELREEGRQVLLAHFGLADRAARFPLEELRNLSPSELHRLAVSYALSDGKDPPSPPVSDRIGGHIPAALAA